MPTRVVYFRHRCCERSPSLPATPAHGSGLWPARGQAPAGAYGWNRSRPSPRNKSVGWRPTGRSFFSG